MKNIKFKEVDITKVPKWNTPDFNEFVKQYLIDSNVDMESLSDKDYNEDIQCELGNTWIGAPEEDINLFDEYAEFVINVCGYLDDLIALADQESTKKNIF